LIRRSSIARLIGKPTAEPHVAARIVRHRGAVIAEAGHVFVVEPDAVGDGEMRPQDAEAVEMRGLRSAIEPDTGHRLHFRFADMAVQSEVELARQIGAAKDEGVRAVVRDRRRDCRAYPLAVERPIAQRRADRRQGRLRRRKSQLGDPLLERRRQRIPKAGDRFIEAPVGDHRGDYRAHPDIGIGPARQRQPFGGRQRPFEGEIITSGATLQHHLDRAELGRQVLILGSAVPGDPRRRAQQQFERPAVAHTLGEVAVPVGVGVDETGMEQPVSRRDLDGVARGGAARRANFADLVVLDQDIRGFRGSGDDVEQAPAAQDHVGHAIVSLKSARHDRPGRARSRAMPSVVVQRREAVFEIVLNRPEVLNAANRELIGDLAAATAEAAEDPTARVIVLRGAGSHFCAGGDIKMFGELIGLPAAERRKALYRIVDALHPLLIRLRHMPKPIVAVVQGAAAGVGLSLVAAADLALAAEDAVFATGYIHLGTSPDGGLTATLGRIVGLKQAAELMLLGDRFDAPRAVQLGIVNRLVAPAALEAEAMALATRLAKGPAHAYGRTKGLLQATLGDAFDAQLRRETESFAACAATEEFVEGVQAFLGKRRPNFSGIGQP
jgi:2-(1,2-epoxy-1,2-dihydrophenyl)acetyl-CoA isomerase